MVIPAGTPGEEDGLETAQGETGRAGSEPAEDRPAVQVLADRVAAALIHHEPGWRLPRRSALARRYGVSPAEMEAAIEELAVRHLLRRLPDGQVYRASPADYLITLEGLPDLRASIDPMGTVIDCASRHVSWRRVPEDIGGALGLSPGDPVCVVRCLWTSAGCPAAFSATYLPEPYSFLAGDPPVLADVLRASQDLSGPMGYPPAGGAGRASGPAGDPGQQAPLAGDAGPASPAVPRPAGLYVELQPPAPSVSRSLRLAAGQPAVSVTVRFDDASAGTPMALATAVLRPEMFRVVIESPDGPRLTSAAASQDGIGPQPAAASDP
jgi:hypothetical protein